MRQKQMAQQHKQV